MQESVRLRTPTRWRGRGYCRGGMVAKGPRGNASTRVAIGLGLLGRGVIEHRDSGDATVFSEFHEICSRVHLGAILLRNPRDPDPVADDVWLGRLGYDET